MVDDSRLDCLEQTEDGLGFVLDPDGNLECGPSGLQYTGIVRPRLADTTNTAVMSCTVREDCDCGPITKNVEGEIWAPPNPEFVCQTVVDTFGNPAAIIPAGSTWVSPNIVDVTNNGGCVEASVFYNVYYNVLFTDNPQMTSVSVTTSLSSSYNFDCITWRTDTAVNGLDIYNLNGSGLKSSVISPGGSYNFNFNFSVNNLSDNNSSIGVFDWRIRIDKYVVRNMFPCADAVLGGNGL